MSRTQWASGFSVLPVGQEDEHDAGVAAGISDPVPYPVHHSERSARVTQWSNGFTTAPMTGDMHGGFAAGSEDHDVVDTKNSQWVHGFRVQPADDQPPRPTPEGESACVSVSLSVHFPSVYTRVSLNGVSMRVSNSNKFCACMQLWTSVCVHR